MSSKSSKPTNPQGKRPEHKSDSVEKRTTKPVTYTREFVFSELESILKELQSDKTIVVLGEVFDKRNYSPQRFSEWAETFKDDDEISESIKRIKSILETRLNVKGLKGELNPTMTIFNLKNNYGWKDKTEQEISGKDGEPAMALVKFIGGDSNGTISQ